jgi:hypothetical protein
MTVGKLLRVTSFFLFIAFSMPSSSTAAVKLSPLSDSAADARLYAHIVTRVAEIQNMDKTNLSATEKKELKKELLKMKREGEGLNKRVYLSVGAIIIIILLLLLLF